MHRGAVGLAMICASVGTANAQRCRVAAETNEARLLAFYTAPIAFSMATAPQVIPAGYVRFGAELEYVPKPDAALEQTGACFTQKSEETSLSPVFGRPRITIGAPLGFSIELAYLPPVTIARATPNLFSFAVAHASHFPVGLRGATTLVLRGHGTYGTVKGAITCPKGALQQTTPSAPCYGTEPSDDTFRPNMMGAEFAVGLTPTRRSLSVYAGAGVNRIDPDFRVGFTDLAGFVDTTLVELQQPMVRATVFGGITTVLRQVFDIGAQIYSVPSDATLFRLMGGFRFR